MLRVITRPFLDSMRRKRRRRPWTRCPGGRAGRKSDIAKLAVFLCSEDADFIVGQTIVSDGGTSSLMSLISDFRNPSTARWGTGYVPGI